MSTWRGGLPVHIGLGLVDNLLDLLEQELGLQVVTGGVVGGVGHEVGLAVRGGATHIVCGLATLVVVLQMLLVHMV